ncbi:MAG: hypothetical protein AAFY56_14650 [Pseudomonadota bacterium]
MLADPNIRVVTLTITEKGYGIDPASGALLSNQAEIAADLADLFLKHLGGSHGVNIDIVGKGGFERLNIRHVR